jgi:hypothetical protein
MTNGFHQDGGRSSKTSGSKQEEKPKAKKQEATKTKSATPAGK